LEAAPVIVALLSIPFLYEAVNPTRPFYILCLTILHLLFGLRTEKTSGDIVVLGCKRDDHVEVRLLPRIGSGSIERFAVTTVFPLK
jgi:hypothetical protein